MELDLVGHMWRPSANEFSVGGTEAPTDETEEEDAVGFHRSAARATSNDIVVDANSSSNVPCGSENTGGMELIGSSCCATNRIKAWEMRCHTAILL